MKLEGRLVQFLSQRRLFTEAWIETHPAKVASAIVSRLFTEAWIETMFFGNPSYFIESPLHGGVD